MSMDGFWMEVEQIQQRDERKAEDGSGSEGRLPEGEELWRGLQGGREALITGETCERSRHQPEHARA